MNGWTRVWLRTNGRTIPLMVGLALVVAGTLILVMVLTATGEEPGRGGTLSPSADAGTVTVPDGSPPAGGEHGPPPGRRAPREASGHDGAGGKGPGGRRASDGGRSDQAGGGGSADAETPGSGDPGSGAPGPAVPGSPGKGTGEPNQGSGGTTVSVGDVEVALDPDEPSVTVSIGETDFTVDTGELLP
jgi:hypothetical protein